MKFNIGKIIPAALKVMEIVNKIKGAKGTDKMSAVIVQLTEKYADALNNPRVREQFIIAISELKKLENVLVSENIEIK